MDLSAYCTKETSEAGSWLKILDFDWETEIGCEILVLGPDSAEAVKLADEEQRTALKIMAASYAKKGAKSDASDESSEEAEIKKAVRLTKDWKEIDLDGKSFPYSPANAEFLYRNAPHIRQQILRFYQNRLNFTKPGPKNSAKRSGEGSRSTIRAKAE